MYITVKNLNGTSDNTPPNGASSWLEYWEQEKYKPTFCSNAECFEKAEVGGHVKKVNQDDGSWYITPLCKKCNAKSSDKTFNVDDDYLVPVR